MTTQKTAVIAACGALASVAAMLATASPATAYQTWDDHKLVYGVSGQRYWLDQTAVDHNENAIVQGVANWNAPSDIPVSYSRTYTKSQSRLDFYRISTNDGYCAVTRHYVDTTLLDVPPDRNWWWAKVNIRPQLKDPAACGPADHREGIIAHEMGHAMGLAHAVNSDRLMYTYIASTGTNNPQLDDRNGINHLY